MTNHTLCWNCGQQDHTTASCTALHCFNCQQHGHNSQTCPKSRGLMNRECKKCFKKGHLAKDCTKGSKQGNTNGATNGDEHWERAKRRGCKVMKCRRCDETGHLAKECTNKSKWKCTKCKRNGHGHWDCPSRTSFKPGSYGYCEKTYKVPPHDSIICSKCSGAHHWTRPCPASPNESSETSPSNAESSGNHTPSEASDPTSQVEHTIPFHNDAHEDNQLASAQESPELAEQTHPNEYTSPVHTEMQEDDQLAPAHESPEPTQQVKQTHSNGHASLVHSEAQEDNQLELAQESPEPPLPVQHTASNTIPSPAVCAEAPLDDQLASTPESPESPPHVEETCSDVDTSSAHVEPQEYDQLKSTPSLHRSHFLDKIRHWKPTEGFDHRAYGVLCNRQALVAFKDNDYGTALSLFTKAIALDPTIPTFYTKRAATHTKLRNHIAALNDFTVASSMPAHIPTAGQLVHVARCWFFLGSTPSALIALQNALAQQPANVEANVLRCRVMEAQKYMNNFRTARARRDWQMACNAHAECVRVYALEDSGAPAEVEGWGIILHIVERNWMAAEFSACNALRAYPQDTVLINLCALVHFLTANFSAALVKVLAVLTLDSNNQYAHALHRRIVDVDRLEAEGNAMFRDGNWGKAIAKWEAALQLVGEHEEEGCGGCVRATLSLNKGTALSKLGWYREALVDINTSLFHQPYYFRALRARARTYVGLELYDAAVGDFAAAIYHWPPNVEEADLVELRKELENTKRAALHRETERDFYNILGLERTCTTAEVRKAYLAQSLKHHPDKGGSAEMFQLVVEAYGVLSKDRERLRYDAKSKSRRTFGTREDKGFHDTYEKK